MPVPVLPSLSSARSVPNDTDLLIVGVAADALLGLPDDVAKPYSKRYGSTVAELGTELGAKPSAGTVVAVPAVPGGPRLLLVGVGESEPSAEDLRRAAGAALRHAGGLAAGGSLNVAVSLGASTPTAVQAVAEGALLGSYAYNPISSADAKPHPIGSIALVSPGAARRGGDDGAVETARVVAAAVATAREWINIPPNLLFPESFAEEARGLVKDSKVAIEVLDEKALAKGGFGGLLAVGGGSSRLPRLVRLSYAPRGAKIHLALVGKGITFDSGGLNLKPGDGMYGMKSDMSGAAAVLAATHAIAQLGLKIKVTTYAALAENLPSDTSYRPSDVLTMYGGKTVENGNCDAEGRLVMADALARAGEDEPDLIVDVATLTGACVVALGDRTGGLLTNDEDTADRILDAAELAGEDFWQLPIPKEIRPKMDSKVADIKSTSGDRYGGALVAAAFLREFVSPDTPWAHLDIAGPAFHEGAPYGYVGPGGTGVSVRTLVTLAGLLLEG